MKLLKAARIKIGGYLCAAMEEKPRNDHIPGTMRCVAFKEAPSNRKL